MRLELVTVKDLVEPVKAGGAGNFWERFWLSATSDELPAVSIVPLENHLFLVPAKLFGQQFAIGGDHVVQSADVTIHLLAQLGRARQHDFFHVLLHVSTLSLPILRWPADSDQIMELGILLCQLLELALIVNVLLIPCAIHQPDFPALLVGRIGSQPLDEGAKGRNAGSGGDEQRVAQRLSQEK